MSRQHSPREQLAANGIRIVGEAATELAARAATLQLDPPPPGDLLWTARFRARPRMGGGSAVPALLRAIGDQIRQEWDGCPTLTRDRPVSRPPGRFHGLVWDTIGEAGAWTGELIWRHRHPVLAGTPCTTHLIIEEQQQVTTLILSAAADGGLSGVRGVAGAGQARPALLTALRQAAALTADGFDGAPRILSERDVEPFVREVMLDEARAWPVAVLAPLEQEGYVVPPEELANELFGVAPLYVLERHVCTFRLTDAVGDRRLSAYFGALRIYRRDFSCADRPEDHWLMLRDRAQDPVDRAALVGKLGRLALDRHPPPEGVRSRREAAERAAAAIRAAAPAPKVSTPAEAAPAASPAAVVGVSAAAPLPPELVAGLGRLPGAMDTLLGQLRDLSGTIAQLTTTQAQLADEIARLRTTTAVRATSANAMERRLAGIEALLRPEEPVADVAPAVVTHEAPDSEDETDAGPTLVEVVRQAGSEFSDALLMLDSAEETASDSPFEDIDRVAAVLQAMAYVARRRQEGGLNAGLRAAFQEFGIDYRSGISKSTSDRLKLQYQFRGPNGRSYECVEHIALGGRTYDPRRCLRIYFTSRESSEPRFVIGHVGRHLTNMTTT